MLYGSSWQSITDEIRVNKIKSYSVRWWNQGCSKSRTYPRVIAIVLEPHDDDSLNVGVRSCSPNFQTNPNSSWNRSPIIWRNLRGIQYFSAGPMTVVRFDLNNLQYFSCSTIITIIHSPWCGDEPRNEPRKLPSPWSTWLGPLCGLRKWWGARPWSGYSRGTYYLELAQLWS